MKTYALAGASNRCRGMFARPIKEKFSDTAKMVGVYDINEGRSEIFSKEFDIPVFKSFEDMINTTKPDVVIVTTVDAFHHEYIIKAMEMGCDVITEKPMTIDTQKIHDILEAEDRTGKRVRVSFNYRYSPHKTKIKELISEGVIGDIYSVDFEWFLDRNMDVLAHGTSYFRRWNRYMEKSGGLLVHKSTHHFDLVNWWIGDHPVEVCAFAKLNRYGKNGPYRAENCRACEHKKECEFYYDVTKNATDMELYVGVEEFDHYYKDGCVFAEDINIYDTMAVNVRYSKGTLLTYSLNATCSYEGWKITFNGSKGRIEAFVNESGSTKNPDYDVIKIFDLKDNVCEVRVPFAKTGHGGGDVKIQRSLFVGGEPDPMGHEATSIDGAYSVSVGACANKSIKEHRFVKLAEEINYPSRIPFED